MSTMSMFWNFVEFSSDPACGLALLGVQGAEWDLLGLDCPDLGAGALGQRSNNKIQQTKTSKHALKICAETSFFRRRCPRVLTYKLKLKKIKACEATKTHPCLLLPIPCFRFLDSTLGPWFILLHLQVTGAVQRAPSARGVAEQTRLYLRVGWLDGTGSRKTIFVVMCDLSQQVGYPKRRRDSIYIYMYRIAYHCLNFLCAEKQADIDNDRQNAILLHFASAFRRSWCAWGRKVSVKLSSFGTKPSKFCLTVGKNAGMWCHSLLVTGIFPGQVCDACGHSDVLLTFPMVSWWFQCISTVVQQINLPRWVFAGG